jgi:hypothetical protein
MLWHRSTPIFASRICRIAGYQGDGVVRVGRIIKRSQDGKSVLIERYKRGSRGRAFRWYKSDEIQMG